MPTFAKNLLNATSAGVGGVTHLLKFGGISSFLPPTAGGKSAGVGRVDVSTANITTFSKNFRGIAAYKVPSTIRAGAVSAGVGRVNQQHLYPGKLFGAVSAGVGGADQQHHSGKLFGAVAPGVGSHTYGSGGYGAGPYGTSVGTGGTTKTITVAKILGATSETTAKVAYLSTAPQKSFRGVSAYAPVLKPRNLANATSAGVGSVNQTHGTFTTYTKNFGAVSRYIKPVPRLAGVSSGVGGFQKTFTGPIQKTFGVVGRGRGGFPGKVPRTFGAKSALTASWIDLIPGAYGSGAYGAGPYGGGQFIITVRGVSGHGVGGFTVNFVSGSSRSFGAITPGIGAVAVNFGRKVGAVSRTSGGMSYARNRKPGAVSPGLGGITKTIVVSKSFGSIAPSVGSISKVKSVARNTGAVGSGVAGYQVTTFRTFTLLVGGIGSGVGGTNFNGALAIHSFGAKSKLIAELPHPTRVAVKVVYGVSRVKGGAPTPIKKTIGAIAPATAGGTALRAIAKPAGFGAFTTIDVGVGLFNPSAQHIKNTGRILVKPRTGRVLVF